MRLKQETYWVLIFQAEDGALLILVDPRLISAMDEDSQQWQEAMKVDVTALVKDDGAQQVVARLKGIRGIMTIQEAVTKWREVMRDLQASWSRFKGVAFEV